jgi:hypothetical protein
LSFILNSDGLDAVRRKIKEITDGMNPSTTSNHGIRVTNLLNSLNSTNFNFENEDGESLECLIMAIERNLNHMPELTRQIFERLLDEFKAKRESM